MKRLRSSSPKHWLQTPKTNLFTDYHLAVEGKMVGFGPPMQVARLGPVANGKWGAWSSTHGGCENAAHRHLQNAPNEDHPRRQGQGVEP